MLGQFCLMCKGGIYVETAAMGAMAQAVECDRCSAVIQRMLPEMEMPKDPQ